MQFKRRRVFFFCAAFFLHKALCESQLNRGIDDFLVFVACDATVDFRIFAALVEGGVLAHKAYQKMPLREVVVNPVEQADGIVFVFWKNHMPQDHAALHELAGLAIFGEIFQYQRTGVLDHPFDCCGGDRKIVRGGGIAGGQFGRVIF